MLTYVLYQLTEHEERYLVHVHSKEKIMMWLNKISGAQKLNDGQKHHYRIEKIDYKKNRAKKIKKVGNYYL